MPRIDCARIKHNLCDCDTRRSGILGKQKLVRRYASLGEDLHLIVSDDLHNGAPLARRRRHGDAAAAYYIRRLGKKYTCR